MHTFSFFSLIDLRYAAKFLGLSMASDVNTADCLLFVGGKIDRDSLSRELDRKRIHYGLASSYEAKSNNEPKVKKLYLLTQDETDFYDSYECLLVCAESEEVARQIPPTNHTWEFLKEMELWNVWASSPDNVTAKLIGVADDSIETGIVLQSFRSAG